MEVLALILGTFASTYALIYSDGPWGVIYRVRNLEAMKDFGILECFICTSFWVSIIITFTLGLHWWILLIGWGASVIIDKLLTYLFTK